MAEEIEQQQPAEQEPAAREAARWRTRLRQVEAERDALAQQINTWQTREVQRLAAARLADPTDLVEIGKVEVSTLLDDQGQVDEQRVAEAVDGLIKARPYLEREPEHVGTFDGGVRGAAVQSPTTWSALLNGGRQ